METYNTSKEMTELEFDTMESVMNSRVPDRDINFGILKLMYLNNPYILPELDSELDYWGQEEGCFTERSKLLSLAYIHDIEFCKYLLTLEHFKYLKSK